jgi:hypothetical protein
VQVRPYTPDGARGSSRLRATRQPRQEARAGACKRGTRAHHPAACLDELEHICLRKRAARCDVIADGLQRRFSTHLMQCPCPVKLIPCLGGGRARPVRSAPARRHVQLLHVTCNPPSTGLPRHAWVLGAATWCRVRTLSSDIVKAGAASRSILPPDRRASASRASGGACPSACGAARVRIEEPCSGSGSQDRN